MSLNKPLFCLNKGLLGPKESQKEDTKRTRHKENTNARCGQTWPLTEPGDKCSCGEKHPCRKSQSQLSMSKSCELPAWFLSEELNCKKNNKPCHLSGSFYSPHCYFMSNPHLLGLKMNNNWM